MALTTVRAIFVLSLFMSYMLCAWNLDVILDFINNIKYSIIFSPKLSVVCDGEGRGGEDITRKRVCHRQ